MTTLGTHLRPMNSGGILVGSSHYTPDIFRMHAIRELLGDAITHMKTIRTKELGGASGSWRRMLLKLGPLDFQT